MAEVLLQLSDRTNESATLDALCYKAGDVVVVVPDGHGWSVRERNNVAWCVVKLPGVAVSTLLDMLAPTYDSAGRLRRKRGRFIDLTKPAIASFIASLPATERVVTLSTGTQRNNFLAARTTKAAVSDVVTLG